MGKKWEGKLQSVALSKAAQKRNTSPMAVKGPRYPWGLSLELNAETMKALGMKKLPPVGSEIAIHARCCVTSASERHEQGSGKSRSASLQITHMATAAGKKTVTAKRK